MYWIVAGDVHENAGGFARIPGVAEAEGIIISGDLTNKGGPAEADRVLALALAANPNVLAQVGNMDEPQVTAHLAARGLNLHREARPLAPGAAVLGAGYSTITPFHTPSEAAEDEIAAWLAEAHGKAKELAAPEGHVLAVIHNAPLGTGLGRISSGADVGSSAVLEYLRREQPEVCVCGHIHEAVGEARVGRCHVINPGLFAEGGYVRVELTPAGFSASLEHF